MRRSNRRKRLPREEVVVMEERGGEEKKREETGRGKEGETEGGEWKMQEERRGGRSKLKIRSPIIDEYWRMFQSFCNFGENPLGSLSMGETKLIRHSSRESP